LIKLEVYTVQEVLSIEYLLDTEWDSIEIELYVRVWYTLPKKYI